ncbi:MAG: hypothetical protein PHE55_12250 [Methylococcaceae bacterium]|nr:hypothetical protein [Methylococcaceae bacterium]
MDFQYRANPPRLLRRFKQLRSQLLRLGDYGRSYGRWMMLAMVAYVGVCGVVLLRLDALAAQWSWFFIFGGTTYLMLAWAFSALWQALSPFADGTSSLADRLERHPGRIDGHGDCRVERRMDGTAPEVHPCGPDR